MNDPGLDGPIQESYKTAEQHIKDSPPDGGSTEDHGMRAEFRKEIQQDEEEEEVGYFQPKRWWFTSTAFPLVAGTFGPLANFFSVCAQSHTWREYNADGSAIPDPKWLLAITGLSLALSLIANVVLLANFGHLLRYSVAQPLTIGLWYLSALLLIIPLGASAHSFSQAYYYSIIAATIYMILPSLLVMNAMGAYVFHAYPPSFNALTVPQRTLMLQTTVYVLYLAAGAGVFAHVEGWNYLDGVYWADYTLLTIGLGSDFPPKTHTGRALLIPFAVGGITLLGLVIGSIRGLVLERGRLKVIRRTVELERQKWIARMDEPDAAWKKEEWEIMRRIQRRAETNHKYTALGTSMFAFLALWFLGAMVFWFAEAPQSWTYFESLYFSYTSLLTIGYGDFFPMSNAGKPFFVVWSLMAVPTVTILISNVGDILLGWVRGGLMLGMGEKKVLPKRENAEGVPENQRSEKAGNKGELEQMGTDVERLGQAVEHAEEERGQGGGLAARVAKQVSRLAQDLANKPEMEYAWEDWEAWLALLGERTESQKREEHGSSGDSVRSKEKRGEWTWLGDDGPLFSGMSETQWILGKLCERLEEVLKEEIGSSRAGKQEEE
ncbi:tandem pore domain K+ channel [Mycena epipterygia]|nr:tandem pore domain K+ channel [Mycena epipterygia]